MRLTEMPQRPKYYDGALAVFGLAEDVDEAKLCVAFAEFGVVESVEIGVWPSAIVRFVTHEAALAAKQAAARLTSSQHGMQLCGTSMCIPRDMVGHSGVSGGTNP